MAYKNKEDAKRNKKTYYLRNKEIIKERARLWNLAHPERRNLHGKKYREKQKGIYGQSTQTNGRELDLPVQNET